MLNGAAQNPADANLNTSKWMPCLPEGMGVCFISETISFTLPIALTLDAFGVLTTLPLSHQLVKFAGIFFANMHIKLLSSEAFFSGKYSKYCSAVGLTATPRPAGGPYSTPQNPSWIKGPTSKGN